MKIYVDAWDPAYTVKVYLFNDDMGKKENIFMSPDSFGMLQAEVVDRDNMEQKLTPFLNVDFQTWNQILDAFVIYHQESGKKLPVHGFNEGKLEATSKEVDDLKEIILHIINKDK